ncbi:MAG: hypothetical protein IAF38_17530, partial [Bacteroidia bacterium]|nr:hypothetical protein [Bacteroidia bacterium]
ERKYKEAFYYLYRGLTIDAKTGSMDLVKEDYIYLSKLYEESTIPLPDTISGKTLTMEQMRLRALYYHKRYISIRDTLFSEENKKQLVRKEMSFEFEKKEAMTKAEQDKKEAAASAEKSRQRFILVFVSFILILVAAVAVIIFRSLRIARKQKTIIEEQKHIVEEKQKEILDSIYYARRIQRSLLTQEKYISRNLNRMMK